MPDEVAAFGGREEIERGGDQCEHLIEVPWTRGAEEGFQLRKRELDRIQIGTIGGQKDEARSARLDRGSDRRLFVRRQVVHDDHVARPEAGGQDLIDVGLERGLSTGPSKTAGACNPSRPSATMTVWVCQWPHGV